MYRVLKIVKKYQDCFVSNWRPTISSKNIQLRARMLFSARSFFQDRNIVEVETPLLGNHTVTDLNIDSFELIQNGKSRYLQTSPEYAMKRMLAAGAPDIYQICKSFRLAESGTMHNPEFTLIEWYRLGFSLEQMINETVDLLQSLLATKAVVEVVSYHDMFKEKVGISLDDASDQDVQTFAVSHGLMKNDLLTYDQSVDFIFSQCVIPKFSSHNFTVVTDYPASQAALAKLNDANDRVSERFEVFYQGVELANGYHELTDPDEQQLRFQNDINQRKVSGKMTVESDQRLLDAMQSGLPDCSGVAVGFDRVMMVKTGAKSISEVMCFDWSSA